MRPEFQRFALSPRERELRSRASQLLSGAGLIHGNLVERFQVCGKESCHCARGEKHRTLVLTVRREKKLEQLYIPKPLEPTVRRWLDQGRDLQELLRQISQLHWEKLRQQKQEKKKEEG
jgi:hypothetical protein